VESLEKHGQISVRALMLPPVAPLILMNVYCLEIPLLLVKIRRSKYKYTERVDKINQNGIFEWCNVVDVR